MRPRREPIGVILAGGLGRRIGGAKATVKLRGRPLIAYPLEALATALRDVAIIAKPDTELPNLPGVTVWIEPWSPRRPLVGITHALAFAAGRPVLVCPADLPFLSAALIARIAHTDPVGAPAVVTSRAGTMQPLLGCYQPQAAALLKEAAADAEMPLRQAVAAIGPRSLEVEDADELFDINAPDDLLQAAGMLDRRSSHPARPR